jgi:hypothetical protein
MALLNICASRIPGMTHAEYCRYLKDNHARLVLGTKPVAKFISSYVQQHVFDAAYRDQAPAARFDSASHLSAAAVADHLAAVATREYKDIIAPDEPNFSDNKTVLMLFLNEFPLETTLRGPSQYRLLHYLAAKSGLSNDTLIARWAEAHVSLQNEQPALFGSVRRAVLYAALEGPMGPPAYSGMCELGFVSMEDVPAMCAYARAIEARLQDSTAPEKGFFLLTEAVPVSGTIW